MLKLICNVGLSIYFTVLCMIILFQLRSVFNTLGKGVMIFFGISGFSLASCHTHTVDSPCFIFCLNVSQKQAMSNRKCHISATFLLNKLKSSIISVWLRTRRLGVQIPMGVPFFLSIKPTQNGLAFLLMYTVK